MPFNKLTLLTVVLALLSSCSTWQLQSTAIEGPLDPEVRQALLKELNEWTIKGKVGLRQPGKSITAAIKSWKQTDENYKIELSSTFFGLGAVELRGNDAYVLYFENGDGPYTSFEPELLIEELLGYAVPIALLPNWIKGLPAPEGEAVQTFDDRGLLKTMKQQDWDIHYLAYTPIDSILLPTKLELKQGEITVKLVIKSWDI